MRKQVKQLYLCECPMCKMRHWEEYSLIRPTSDFFCILCGMVMVKKAHNYEEVKP